MNPVIQRLDDDELGLIRPLFETVFGSPISHELLHWKYGEGRGQSWVVLDEQRKPLLHCGLCYRHILHGGSRVRAAQLVDLMAAPKMSGLARRNSPFNKLMRAILTSLPDTDNLAGIAFGFPSDRAMRLGEHLNVYRSVGTISRLQFTPHRCHANFSIVDRIDQSGRRTINRLWKAMAKDLRDAVLGTREPTYVLHRYCRHPERRYRFLFARSRLFNRPLGMAVIHVTGQQMEIMDLVGSRKVFPRLLETCCHWMASANIEAAEMLISEPFATELAPFADVHQPTEFRIMANPFSPPEVVASLNNRWWLTGGDTDYR